MEVDEDSVMNNGEEYSIPKTPYKIISQSWLENIQAGGSDKICENDASHAIFSDVFYELLASVLNDDATAEDVAHAYSTALQNRVGTGEFPFNGASTAINDVIWLLDVETEDHTTRSEKLQKVVKLFIEKKLLDAPVRLLEDLDLPQKDKKGQMMGSLLANTGLATENTQKQFVRFRTKQIYTQQKYNLFREETEGYSKLLTELLQRNLTENDVDNICKKIGILEGCFDIDPNRVSDVILEAFEQNYQNTNFLSLLKSYNRSHLALILGFKFGFYKTRQETPDNFFRLAATLIKNGVMQVEDILVHLCPGEETDALMEHKKFANSKLENAKQMRHLLLNSEESTEQQKKNRISPTSDTEVPSLHTNNQRFGLLVGLLETDAIQPALLLYDFLYAFSPQISPKVSRAMIEALHRLISPLYSHLSAVVASQNKGVIRPREYTSEDVVLIEEQVLPLLLALDVELYHDPSLFAFLIRLMADYFENHVSRNPNAKTLFGIALQTFVSTLYLCEKNSGLSYELWSLLRLVPYKMRFEVYRVVKERCKELSGRYYLPGAQYRLVGQYNTTSLETKSILKRLAKESQSKVQARNLSKVSHSGGLVVSEEILAIVQSYDNVIEVVLEAFRYATPLFHDMLAFEVLHSFSGMNKKQDKSVDMIDKGGRIRDNGTKVETYLENRAKLIGQLFRKFSTISHDDLQPFIQYLIARIKAGHWEDLVLLKEIVSNMSGIDIREDINDDQMDAQAGGEVLRAECGSFEKKILGRTVRKATIKLQNTLVHEGYGRSLLILLAQLRDSDIFLYDEQDMENGSRLKLPMIISSFDTIHESFQILLQFLREHTRIVIDSDVASVKEMDAEEERMRREAEEQEKKERERAKDGKKEEKKEERREREKKPILSIPDADQLRRYRLLPETINAILRGVVTKQRQLNIEVDDNVAELESGPPISDPVRLQKCQALLDQIIIPALKESNMETIPSLPHNLYNLFYSLELYDVYGMQNIQIINILVPIKSYQDAFLRIKQQQLDKNIAPKKKETADSLLKSLVEEKDAQIKHNEALVTLIKRARHVIIQSLDDQSGEADTMWQFLQNCILPRVLYSSTDAIYCAKFIEMMHLASVPYFSTLQCYFRSFSSIPAWLMSCTENEADRIGRFLRTLLATIKPWIEDEEKYKQYAYKIGFVKNIKNIDSGIMDYQVFKKSVVKKLCSTLTAGFEVVFAKADSTCARNVLKALNHAASNNLFPMYRRDAEKLKECVGKLADSEIENIKVLATRYATNLDQLISKVLPPEEKKPAPVQAVQQLSALSAPFVPPSRRDSKKDDKEPTTPVTPKPQREEKRADRSPSTEIGDRKRREDRGKDERRRGRDRKAERTEDQPVEEKSSKNDKMDVDEKESSTPTPSPATPVTPSGSRRKEVKREASEPPPPPPPASPTKESSPKRDEKATGEQMNLKLQELLSKKKEEERDTRKDGRGDSRDKHRDDAPPPPPPSNDKHDDERGSRHHDRDGRDGRDNRGRNRGDRDNRRNERRNDDPPAKDRGTKREREDSKQRVDEEKEPKRRKDTEDEPSVKEERKEERGGRRRITRPHV